MPQQFLPNSGAATPQHYRRYFRPVPPTGPLRRSRGICWGAPETHEPINSPALDGSAADADEVVIQLYCNTADDGHGTPYHYEWVTTVEEDVLEEARPPERPPSPLARRSARPTRNAPPQWCRNFSHASGGIPTVLRLCCRALITLRPNASTWYYPDGINFVL